jgi:nuclease HARBI1
MLVEEAEMETSSSSGSSEWSSNNSFISSSDDDNEEFNDILDDAVATLAAANPDQASTKKRPTIIYVPVRICDIADDDFSYAYFRFRKTHLQEVANKLWPRLSPYLSGTKEHIQFGGSKRYSAPFETLFLMVLFRFSRPRRIRNEMEEYFGFGKSKISAGILTMVSALHSLAVKYLDNPAIHRDRMPYYAAKIHEKCGLVDSVWGFIDGTRRKICRPSYFQKQAYSGHKRSHGIKFQSVVTPDGLFALMFGPIMGNRHDSYMLAKSELIPKLREFMPDVADPPAPAVFSLYGDPAYPQSEYIFGGYRNPRAGSPEAQWNTEMSKVREVVEWGFANIVANWAFLNFKPAMMIFKSPVAKFYIVGAFLANLRTCFYGNQTMAYFDANALTLDEYLALID